MILYFIILFPLKSFVIIIKSHTIYVDIDIFHKVAKMWFLHKYQYGPPIHVLLKYIYIYTHKEKERMQLLTNATNAN